jgi:DNA invertase Pin-like site-specific DNA recombinase
MARVKRHAEQRLTAGGETPVTSPPGHLVGYARTSTVEQAAGLEAQERDLRAAGCVRVFAEQVSSIAKREKLAAALDYVRDGDVMVVTRPDRLARSVSDLLDIISRLEAKGVGLLVLSMGGQPVDTRTPTGRLTLTLLGAVAEFERALMLERQREGIAKAKAEGRYTGRKPTVRAQGDEMRRLKADGVGPAEIARRLGVARSSVYRVLECREVEAASEANLV